jgi:hypothetical protein
MGKKFDVYKLQLPVFNMSSLKVIYEDHRTYASDADVRPNNCTRSISSQPKIETPYIFIEYCLLGT